MKRARKETNARAGKKPKARANAQSKTKAKPKAKSKPVRELIDAGDAGGVLELLKADPSVATHRCGDHVLVEKGKVSQSLTHSLSAPPTTVDLCSVVKPNKYIMRMRPCVSLPVCVRARARARVGACEAGRVGGSCQPDQCLN